MASKDEPVQCPAEDVASHLVIHFPHRSSDVAQWVKKWRDVQVPDSQAWYAIDRMLDDYRLHADTATPLFVEVTEH